GVAGWDVVDPVDLAALQHGEAGGGLGDRADLQVLDRWGAPPVAVVRLQDCLVVLRPLDELVRAGANRLEPELAGPELLERLRRDHAEEREPTEERRVRS